MSVALINEVLRDFERYTGDGKPNAPIGHPLPIGDPRSGIHNPAKFRLRELLIAILQAMGDPDALQDILDQLSDKADNSDVEALAQRNVATIWLADFSGVTFPPGTDTVLQRQNSGGGFFRIWMSVDTPTPPNPSIHQQDATGQWWELFYDSTQVEFRGTRLFNGRQDAADLLTSNPPDARIHRVFSLENGFLAARARNAQLDALFSVSPYWGIEAAIRLNGSPASPLISGRANAGEFLDLDLGPFDSTDYEINWQWSATGIGTQNWFLISGATGASYRLGDDQEGRFLRARIRPAGELGTWTVSNVIGPVGERLAGTLPDDVSASTAGIGDSRSRLPRFHDNVLLPHDFRDGVGAAPPLDLYKDHSIVAGMEWLGNVKAPLPSAAANLLTTYDPPENVIHPCVVEFFNEFCGYRFVCAITAYPNGPALEDPFVYGSNDRVNWTFLGTAPQPLDVKLPVGGSYNSDTFVTHDPRKGELIVGYRRYEPRTDGDSSEANSDVVLLCRSSRNGYSWSDAREILRIPADEQIMLAPTMIFDPATGIWHMWVINRPVMNHWTAPSLYGPWTLDAAETDLSVFDTPHHHEIKWVGDKLVCLMYSRGDGNLFFGVFEDGSWTDIIWNMTGVLDPRPASLYKASFVPLINAETQRISFDLWWTNGAAGPAGGTDMGHGRKLQYSRTSISALTVTKIPTTVDQISQKVNLLGAAVDGFGNAKTEGYLTKGNGQIASASASWTYTDFIPVRAGQVVEYVGGINRDQGAAIAYYDSNQGYVADGLVADPAGSGPIQSLSASVTIPAGVSYLRAATINTGTYGLTYIPSGSTSPEAFAESVISTMEHAAGVEKMRLQTALNALLSGSALPSKLANLPGIGDSITVGANATTAANRFLNRVAAALGATVTNYGIGGTVLQNSNGSGGTPLNNNGRDRFRGLFTGGSKKDFALIAYGFNDARYTAAPSTFNAAAYKNDYREILVGLLCDGYRRDQILIVGPHYITDIGLKTGSEGFTGQTRAGFEEYVTAARDVAEEFGTLYFDSYAHMRDYMRANGSPYDMSTFSDNDAWDLGDDSATYVGALTTVSNNQGGNVSPVPEGDLWISADIRRLGGTTGRARVQIRWLSSENPDTVISTTSGDYITLSDTSVQIFTNEGTPPEGAVFYDLMLTVDGANTDGQVQFSNITVGQGVISDDNIHPTNLGHEVSATGIIEETTVLNQRSGPVITGWSASGGDMLLAWAPVAGAVSYEVAIVEFDSLVIPAAEAVSATQHRFSAPPTGRHTGMVRAVFSDGPGPWSVSNPAAI
ncbi:SGNH/GDSL hydrolase family protein [Paracoccus onubensis]|uniref:SGNH/GDSL hydrolase family protein n=1 Tax=Paracoccus onubensis TaxID=1675788 RepID=A0A418T407_9RHOB|nr:SGNH/GDSL hydrolase family protein [Paracoccus onubensis]RJE87951.1 SGNH/GDSL hydrolase family protein [Paracoccus onubensis]